MPNSSSHRPNKRKPAATARRIALEILEESLKGITLDQALEGSNSWHTLPPRDRGFARILVTTTLRRLGQIDALIAALLEKPLSRRGDEARNVIRLGIAQLLFLDVPAHAAVGETVDLAQGGALAPYRKLINALLRRLQRESSALLAKQDVARLNTPDWLWDAWNDAYGEDTCRAIAAAHLVPPPHDVTVKDDVNSWAERLNATRLPNSSLRLPELGNITELDGFNDGAWWVQDAAATLPVQLLGDVQGQTVIDLCAAPGGKTAQLAANGATAIAVDRSDKRLKRLHENMDRLGFNVETITADASEWQPETPVDAVLLDAPCSATGTIRRHPDLAWTKSQTDVAKLAALQGRLLRNAIDMVRPGGTLIYCTCSLQPEEGPRQIEALLSETDALQRVPITADEIGGLSDAITKDGDLRTLPCHWADVGGMDGFFACRLKRQ